MSIERPFPAPDEDVEELEEDTLPGGNVQVSEQQPLDLPNHKDRIRIVKWLLWVVVAATTALIIVAVLGGAEAWTRVERISTLVLSPLIALLGTAIGWYFSSRSSG